MASFMEGLANKYEKPSAMNKVRLEHCLFNLRIAEGASLANHLNEFTTVTAQLSSIFINSMMK